MDVEILSRIQFAFTVAFHYIYPPLSIGLGLIMVIMEGLYLRTGEKMYEQMARFWTKIFALTFGIGVATGIVMEFEFGTNWATYSRFVGDIFGSALAFLFSALTLALLLIVVAIELYPVIILSTLDAQYNITVYNAASSEKSLGIMLLMAAIGAPLVLSYTIFVYRTFWGKVKLDETSY